MRYILISIALSAFSFWQISSVQAAPPVFEVTDRTLTIKTDRFEVDWEDGSLVRVTNLVSNSQILTSSSRSQKRSGLPVGLGSFYQNQSAARAQHAPLSSRPIPFEFKAQHSPDKSSTLDWHYIPNGIQLEYRGLQGDSTAKLIQQFTVENGTGDLIIRQHGSSSKPGTFGISFSVENLNPDLSIIIPFFSGERWGRNIGKGKIQTFAWPRFWSAALLIVEAPENGCFSIWAQDGMMRPKYLHAYNDGARRGFAFESCEEAPYENKFKVESCEWRFNTFGGQWMEPALRYKTWMKEAYGITPITRRGPNWINDIALFWPGYIVKQRMTEMAERINPRNVLLHYWGMLPGFNRRIPEYKPKDKLFREQVSLAHKYGYRVGAYTSMLLVDTETHPDILQRLDLDYSYDALTKDKPNSPGNWLVAIHPGSSKWRDFYVGKMSKLHNELGLDLLYQDMSGSAYGSTGLIEGKNIPAAVVACEEAIKKAMPQIGLMGEFWNEVNAFREDFAINNYLNWFDEKYRDRLIKESTIHPILSFLFSDFSRRVAFSKPFREKNRFHLEERINEVTGTIPYWNTSVNDLSGEALLTLIRADLWAKGFRPYFPTQWGKNDLAYMKNESNDIVRYVADGQSSFCYLGDAKQPGNLVYARLTGMNRYESKTLVHIAPWIAYSETGAIAMDPLNWYCLFPGAPPASPIRVTQVPDHVSIDGVRISGSYILVSLKGRHAGTVKWTIDPAYDKVACGRGVYDAALGELAVTAPATLLFYRESDMPAKPEQRYSLANWQCNMVSGGWYSEQAKGKCGMRRLDNGLFVHGCTVLPPIGGRDAEISFDRLVHIPAWDDPALVAYAGLERDCPGDGVSLVARVNGREIWRREVKAAGVTPLRIPLKEYAGHLVLLSFAVDCGKAGNNISCDESFWGAVDVVGED